MKITKAQEVAKQIGLFYLQKNENDYPKTEDELENLRISNIEVDDESVTIHLGRPGLIIGRRGTVIEALTEFLNIKVKLIEDNDNWLNWLIPRKYDDFEYVGPLFNIE